jgi:chemotaxis protein CheD
MPLQTTVQIDLGHVEVANNRSVVFNVPHLGSSVAVVVFDKVKRIGGVAHVVLPESTLNPSPPMPGVKPAPGKFADTAIPLLIEQFTGKGGEKTQATVSLVGGAQLFNFGGGAGSLLNVGSRNIIAIRAALSKEGMPVDQLEVGGNKVRTLRLVIATGQLLVRTIGEEEKSLAGAAALQ